MSRSQYPHVPSKPTTIPPSVTPGTPVVKNGHTPSNPPAPEPHWEPVIDSATD